ncbi:MAG: T9SS type A sorting domain-containing protein [bacterium]
MRIAAVAVLCVLACGSLAHGQVPVLGIYTDTNGDDCNIVDSSSGLLQAYVVLKDDVGTGISSVRFAAPLPACFTGSYLTDTNVFPLVIGNSQDGVAVAFGTCRNVTTHILTIVTFGSGTTPDCCQWPIVADPNTSSGEVELWDCSTTNPQLVAGDVVTSTINGDGSCPCGVREGLSQPSPPDGSVNQSIDTQLSWSPGTLVGYSYDVYFGTTDPPPLVATGLGGPTYDPGTLEVSTTYYWQIVARLGGDVVDGPVWSFTTQGLGWTMSPPDGAGNVSINTVLSWSLLPGAWDDYDVYFGTTSPPPLVAAGHVAATYDPGVLDPSTTYYWQITANEGGDPTPGPGWSFTTEDLVWTHSPPDTAIDQPLGLLLDWNVTPGNWIQYDVYLGETDSTTALVTTVDSSQYWLGSLDCATTYYWNIVARDGVGGELQSPTWSFITQYLGATNPSPPDTSSYQSVNVDLSWDEPPCGGNYTYDVYLGSYFGEPVLVAEGIDSTNYDPGPLYYGEYYDWYVVTNYDDGYSKSSPVWSFRTENYVLSNPSPPDSSVNHPLSLELSWDPFVGAGDIKYDVCFGTIPSPPIVAADLDTNVFDPGPLALNTMYYWRIMLNYTSPMGHFYASGPLWKFSTIPTAAQKLRVPVMINYCGLITSDTVTVDITIDGNMTPIGAGGVDLTYDSELLSLISCEPGDLTADWRYFDYADRDSFIRIGGYDLDYIPPGRVGSFARLTFLSNCCNLDSTRAAVLRLENLTDELATLTPVHGAYRCSYFERDGDVDVSGSVTPGDARCAFRGYLSFPTAPTGNCGQMGWDVRSDVDCSMDITPADALCIFNHWLDGSCVFCGESGAPLPSPHPEPLVPAKIAVGEPRFDGIEVVVPILVSRVPMLSAFGFEVDYPAHELEYIAAEPAPATEYFQEIDGIPVADGRIRLGGYGSNPVAAANPIAAVDLRFKLLTSRPSGTIVIDSYVDDVRSAWTVRWSFPNAPGKKTHQDITLLSNYPNPFNPVTVIRYEIPAALGSVHVKLAVFNVEGKLVRNLVDEPKSPGAHQVEWDAHSDRGDAVASGIYFYVLQVGNQTFKKKMVLLK